MSARAERSPARALAQLYCPPAQRAVLAALLGLEAQIRSGLDRNLDHAVAHARLTFWREECARLSAAEPRHPLMRTLNAHFPDEKRAVLAGLRGFADLATWDLAQATFESRRELEAYSERWSAALALPLAQLALGESAAARALTLGARLHSLELLNRLGSEARAGRLRLPLDELAAAQLAPQALAAPHWSGDLAALVRSAHARGRADLSAAVAAFGAGEQPPLRALLVWAQVAQADSRRASAGLPRPSASGDHHALLDGWRAWRAARRAQAGRFSLEP